MDLLLTPLVSKFLQQYVKRSAEGSGSDLKVRREAAAVGCTRRLRSRPEALPGGSLLGPARPWGPRPAAPVQHPSLGSIIMPPQAHRLPAVHPPRLCLAAPPAASQVSFSRGNVLTLHNLELNLVGAGAAAQRAPWLAAAGSSGQASPAALCPDGHPWSRSSRRSPWAMLVSQPAVLPLPPPPPRRHRCWAARRRWRTCGAPLRGACPSPSHGPPSHRSPSRRGGHIYCAVARDAALTGSRGSSPLIVFPAGMPPAAATLVVAPLTALARWALHFRPCRWCLIQWSLCCLLPTSRQHPHQSCRPQPSSPPTAKRRCLWAARTRPQLLQRRQRPQGAAAAAAAAGWAARCSPWRCGRG